MTQTLPAISQLFKIEEQSLVRFRDTLTPGDQQVLDELFDSIQFYNPAVSQAAAALPMELLLLTMLMEHHKMVQFLIDRLNYYDEKLYLKRVKRSPSQGLQPTEG